MPVLTVLILWVNTLHLEKSLLKNLIGRTQYLQAFWSGITEGVSSKRQLSCWQKNFMFRFLREKPRAQGSIWRIGQSVLLPSPDLSAQPPGRQSRLQQRHERQEERQEERSPSRSLPRSSAHGALPAPSPGSAAGLGQRHKLLQGASRASLAGWAPSMASPLEQPARQGSWAAQELWLQPLPSLPIRSWPQAVPRQSQSQGCSSVWGRWWWGTDKKD